jgi:dTDP-4-amino-4,6-dideoxygalactose transaminase
MSEPFAVKSNQSRTSQTEIGNTSVPFVDLKAQYRTIETDVDAAIARILEHTSFVMGREVAAFEEAFANYLGVQFCIGVNSGTAALQLALMAYGIGRGDEVIVPSFTFFATAEAVSIAGATPVFVDIDPVAYTVTAEAIEQAITPRTRAIIPVHLYGQPVDLDPILALAGLHKLHVIEDAAQAHGAQYKRRRVGTLGHAGCFSFYPSKNLGAYGEAGAVVTNDEECARRLRLLRDHGARSKYVHDIIGYNFRMEEMQAAVLNVKLPHLDDWNSQRRRCAARYHELLGDCNVVLPQEMDYAQHVFHLYAVQCEQRDAFQQHLAASGIQTGIHYPIPNHRQPAYSSLGYKPGRFPVTEQLCESVLSLPMFAELTEEQQLQVAQACRSFG